MRKLILNNSYQQKYYLSNRDRLLEKQKNIIMIIKLKF